MLVNEKGYTYQQAADNLGISLSATGRWPRAKRATTAASATKKATLNLIGHSELTRLRRENERLLMEREILKKAAAFPSAYRVRGGRSLRLPTEPCVRVRTRLLT
jgi:transposase